MKRIPLKKSGEFDALTNARKYYKYLARAGVAKKIKQSYNRRFRRIFKYAMSESDNY